MNLKATYPGGSDPFEGDLELLLHALPYGALVNRAIISIAPAKPEEGKLFEEIITFPSPDISGEWGASKISGPDSCEVDFHSRRTLSEIMGSGGIGILQVDLGGVYIGVAEDGTFMGPDKNACQVNLANENTWQKLPSLMASKIKLYKKGANPEIDIKAVKIRSTPSNVSVRLAGMPPLWTIPGELATGKASLDFAPVLNAFLAGAKAEYGVYRLPFIIHSDTIARLDIAISIDYSICMPVIPSYLPEIKLHYGYAGLPDIDKELMTIDLPRGAKPVDGTLAVLNGTFKTGRVAYGGLIYSGETIWIDISEDRSLAQPFFLDNEAKDAAIDLSLKAENGPASLHLTVQEDDDGKPSGKILAVTEIELEEQSSEGSTWICASLPDAFRFLKSRRYWLVLQSLSGTAGWQTKAVDSSDGAIQLSEDGGFSWRLAQIGGGRNLQVALFRVRETPLKFKMPVVLQIGVEPNHEIAKFDRFDPLGKAEFEAGFAGELKSYLDHRGFSSPCPARELLKNGGFDEPDCVDSDRIVLGIECTKEDGFLPAENSKLPRTFKANGFAAISIDQGTANLSRLVDIVSFVNRTMEKVLLFRERDRIKLHTEVGITGYVYPFNRCKQDEPASWQASGNVSMLKDNDNNQIAVLSEPLSLLSDSDSACCKGDLTSDSAQEISMISQIVEITEGCTYSLSFFYWAAKIILQSRGTSQANAPALASIDDLLIGERLEYFSSINPSWEIIWLDAAGQVINQVIETIIPSENRYFATGYMQEYNRVLVAPWGSSKAEIRFKQPRPGVLMLRDISFIHNTDLLIMGNLNPTVSKRFDLNEGDCLILECKARQKSITKENFQEPEDCATLKIKWLPEGVSTSETPSLILGRQDFPDHIWILNAPSNSKQMEVRLVQLGGVTEVESISLRRIEKVPVPLAFLSEAPGEMTVSGMRIIYDLT
ncbi:MAG: hypothetical protein PHW87_10735 [Methanothrix sp.]|nr:hypothetical protein [Methanothrix sp.]